MLRFLPQKSQAADITSGQCLAAQSKVTTSQPIQDVKHCLSEVRKCIPPFCCSALWRGLQASWLGYTTGDLYQKDHFQVYWVSSLCSTLVPWARHVYSSRSATHLMTQRRVVVADFCGCRCCQRTATLTARMKFQPARSPTLCCPFSLAAR